jgi:hypothetical protein
MPLPLGGQLRATNGNGLARYLRIEVRDSGGPVMQARFAFEMEHLQ